MDPAVAPFIVILACLIAMVGWFVAAGLVAVFVGRKAARVEKNDPGGAAQPTDSALLFYALSVLFWPAGFVCGAYFLKRARTARQGRNCVWIGLAYISVIVVLTCAGMVAVGFVAPEWLGVVG